MSRTTTLLCRLLATTAIVAVAGNLAFGQEQQKTQEGDVVTKTVPIQQEAEGQPAGTEADAQVTEEQPADEGEASEELATEEPAAEEAAEELATEEQPAEGEAAEEVAETPTAPEETFIAAQEEGTLMASDLQGLGIIGADEEEIGEIEDVILHPEGGIFGAVVEVGGFLGIGGKDVALSWREFEYLPEEQIARVNLTREQLEEAPDFMTLRDIQAEEEALAQQAAQPQGTVPAAPAPAAGGSQ